MCAAAVAEPKTVTPATQRLTTWLSDFEKSLKKGDAQGVAGMFAKDGFWRDFLSFTWNLKTMESRDQIKDMVSATASTTGPANWQLQGDATEADGIVEGWITFETASGTGEGHIRLNDEGCWTLLTLTLIHI